MATELEHINLANSNHRFLKKLADVGGHPDWLATVAFYKAVHVVEAVYASALGRHSTTHTDRETTLKTARFSAISKFYSHLLTASRIARYLEAQGVGKYSSFTDFMDEADVRRMIGKKLFGVEQSSLQFLSDAGRSALLKVHPPEFE